MSSLCIYSVESQDEEETGVSKLLTGWDSVHKSKPLSLCISSKQGVSYTGHPQSQQEYLCGRISHQEKESWRQNLQVKHCIQMYPQ